MDDNQFDDIFRKSLENFNSDVPGDMWQRINKKDKDRKLFVIPRFILIVGLLLLTGLSSVYFFGYNDNDNINEKQKINIASADKKTHKSQKVIDEEKIDDSAGTAKNIADNPSYQANNSNKKIQKKLTKNLHQYPEPGKTTDADIADVTSKNIAESSNTNADLEKKSIETSKAATKKDTPQMDTTEDKKTPPDEEDFKDKFSIELFAAPVFPINNISADNSSYEQVLKDAGKMKFSFSFGAKLDIKINKHLSGKIGVQYTQINEKMNFTDSSVSLNNVTYINHYNTLDVPLLLSYSIKQSNFTTSFTSGILLNIHSKYKGAIPDAYGSTLNIQNRDVYNNNTGISLYFGVGFSKEIKNKIDIFAEPYFRYRVKDMTNSMQPFDQKIHTAGISLGMRYRLFKKKDE